MSAKTDASIGGGGKIKTGSYTGDGNATQAITGVGFQPKFIIITPKISSQNRVAMKSDKDTTFAFSPRDGARTYYYVTDNIISLDADGFTVGDGTGFINCFNVLAANYSYQAWG